MKWNCTTARSSALRPAKACKFGITEARAPYYNIFGTRRLADVLDVAGQRVDGIKWAGGSFSLVPREQVRAFSDLAHKHDVYVASGGCSSGPRVRTLPPPERNHGRWRLR